MLFSEDFIAEIQHIDLTHWLDTTVQLSIAREDKVHPFVSGNKFRKLKYNFLEALNTQTKKVLTFGGAYSNHIAAVAAAGRMCNIPTVGVIRGEELEKSKDLNPTLQFARSQGMHLHFVDRETYRLKDSETTLSSLKEMYGDCYVIPEGGTNPLAVQGVSELLNVSHSEFDYITVPVGTGSTMAGLIVGAKDHQTVIGYSALKGTFQLSEVKKYVSKHNFELTDRYCFGGYAKIDSELVRFMNDFKSQTKVPLDPVYTGKMMYGIFKDIKNQRFKENTRILAIHTGGLQGIDGMNQKLKKKNLPQIA